MYTNRPRSMEHRRNRDYRGNITFRACPLPTGVMARITASVPTDSVSGWSRFQFIEKERAHTGKAETYSKRCRATSRQIKSEQLQINGQGRFGNRSAPA